MPGKSLTQFRSKQILRRSAAAALVGLWMAGSAAKSLGDGIWDPAAFSGDASGNWSDSTNWLGGNVASGAGSLADFSQLDVTVNSTITLDTAQTVGSLVFGDTDSSTPATWTLSGSNTLTLSGATAAYLTPTIAVNTSSATIEVVIAGASGLTVTGAGALILGATNTYTGGTVVTNGSLSISSDANLGADPSSATPANLTLDAGSLVTTATLSLNANRGVALNSGGGTFAPATGTTLTIPGVIADGNGSGSLTLIGPGTLALGGTNTYSGATTIDGGTLSISADAGLGTAPASATPGALTFAGGTLATTATLSLNANRGVALNSGGGTFAPATGTTLTVASNIAGTAAMTLNGAGTLILSGTDSYGGGTVITAGTLEFASAVAVPTTGSITINSGGTLEVVGAYTTATGWLSSGAISSSSAGTLGLVGTNTSTSENIDLTADPSLSLGVATGSTVTYTGLLTPGPGGYFVGGGGGTILFTNTNAFTGSNSLTVGAGSGGNVRITASNNFIGSINVKDGTLILGAAGALGVNNPISVAAGGDLFLNVSIDPAPAPAAGFTFTDTQTLTWASSSTGLFGLSSGSNGRVYGWDANINIIGSSAFRIANENTNAASLLVIAANISSAKTVTGLTVATNSVSNILLLGDNTYYGVTTVNGGAGAALILASPSALGTNSTSVSVASGNSLYLGSFSGYSGTIAGFTEDSHALTFATSSTGAFGILAGNAGQTFTWPGAIKATGTSVFTIGVASGGLAISGVITASTISGLSKTGAGLLVLAGANVYTAPTTVSGGVLRASDGVGLPTASNLVLDGGDFETGADVNRALGTGAGQVQLTGDVSGFSAYGGNIDVDLSGDAAAAGYTVVWGAAATFSPTALVLNETTANGTLNFTNSLDLNTAGSQTIDVNANTATLSGNVIATGGGSLVKGGAGMLVLAGIDSYAGGTTVSAGTIEFASAAALPSTGTITLSTGAGLATAGLYTTLANWLASGDITTDSTGALALTADSSENFNPGSGYANLALGAASGNSVTYTGAITPTASGYFVGGGGGQIFFPNANAFTGTHALTIVAGTGGVVGVSGANNLVGTITVTSGMLQILNPSALGSSNALSIAAGGIVDLEGNNLNVNLVGTGVNVSGLTAPSGSIVTDDSSTPGVTTVTANVPSGSFTFTGGLQNGPTRTLAFVKTGAGSLVINGPNANTFTGGLTIEGGEVDVRTNNANILPSGEPVTFEGTGTFAGSSNSATAEALTLGTVTLIAGDATFQSNNYKGTTGTQVITLPAIPTRSPGSTLDFTLAATQGGTVPTPSTFAIAFASPPPTGQSIAGWLFYSADNFAAYDPAGYVRPLAYGTDANAVNVTLGADQATLGASTGQDVELTGNGYSITAQTTTSLQSLKIAGAGGNITLGSGQTLTIASGGIIKDGGTAATISGGAGLAASSGADLIVNTAQSGDVLTILSPISSPTAGVTKTGPGTLVLNGAVAGGAWVNAGTLAGNGSVAGALTLASGATISAGDGSTTPGALTFSASSGNVLTDASNYLWKINDAGNSAPGSSVSATGPGAAGSSVGWDELLFSSLSVGSGTGAGVDVVVTQLGGGSLSSFNPAASYQWTIAVVPPGNGPALAAQFHLDANALSTFAAANSTSTADFSIGGAGDDVYISYSPAPEPTSLALLSLGLSATLPRRRRARK